MLVDHRGQRLDAVGIDLAELLDPAEDIVEFGHHRLDLGVAHRDPGELGDMAHLFCVYGHGARLAGRRAAFNGLFERFADRLAVDDRAGGARPARTLDLEPWPRSTPSAGVELRTNCTAGDPSARLVRREMRSLAIAAVGSCAIAALWTSSSRSWHRAAAARKALSLQPSIAGQLGLAASSVTAMSGDRMRSFWSSRDLLVRRSRSPRQAS